MANIKYATPSNLTKLITLIGQKFSEYLDEAEVKEAITEAIKDAATIEFKIVDSLPETGESKFIYLVPNESEGDNVFDEYFWNTTDSKFELFGGLPQEIDLSDYVKTEDLADYVKTADLADYVKTTDLSPISDDEIVTMWNDIMTPSVEE